MYVRSVTNSIFGFREYLYNSVCIRLFSSTLKLLKQKRFTMKPSNNIYIRYDEGSPMFQALFFCNYEPLKIEREFNFNRKFSEPVDDFILRIKSNMDKVISNKFKKVSKKKSAATELPVDAPTVEVSVSVNDDQFSTSKTCKELFIENRSNKIEFVILGQHYPVVINSPWVDNLALPSTIMVGYPVYPSRCELSFSIHSNSLFVWSSSKNMNGPWTEVGSGFTYIPSENDVSSHLKVMCRPSNEFMTGPVKEYISDSKVILGPIDSPIGERLKYTPTQLSDSELRVVTYNILADVYASTEVAKTELFSSCPAYAIALDYRKQIYLKEILGYHADIICLQEVDEKVFKNDLEKVLDTQGLKGTFFTKGGTIREGVATFYSSKKFKLLSSHRVVLGEAIATNDTFKSIWNQFKGNSAAVENFLEKATVLQVNVLERLSNTKDKLIVANTHLYFHPDADHIRLVQTGTCMEFIKDLISDLSSKNPEDRHSLIFCGDFNSVPDCGPYLLMTNKHVPSDFKDWKSNSQEIIEGMSLHQPFSMKSAYGTPKFTNYTVGFKDCLDYIYYQTDHLRLNKVVPLPSEDVLSHHTALPSEVFPSDHLSLVADFEWS